MEVKGSIRRRRLERINQIRRQIAEQAVTVGGGRPNAPMPHIRSDKTPHVSVYPAPDKPSVDRALPPDPRLQDPEYVWKHRHELFGGGGAGSEDRWERDGRMPPGVRRFIVRLAVSAALFALVWGMFRLDAPWAVRGQQYVRAALTEEFPFARVAAWYDRTFSGAPSFIPAFGDKKGNHPAEKVNALPDRAFVAPVSGNVVAAYSALHPAIELRTSPDAEVKAAATGRVVFVGEKEDIGLTVIVQHANRQETLYGFLAESYVAKNDWVEGGKPIGRVSGEPSVPAAGRLYFAVSKNNQYVNPADVVKFE